LRKFQYSNAPILQCRRLPFPLRGACGTKDKNLNDGTANMFGKNPIRPSLKGTGEILEVQEIFPTFQGEAMYTGWPSVFIRLGGCNLACSFCDTEFESFAEKSLVDIVTEVETLSLNAERKRVRNLVVVTGGEPFRQPLAKLCDALISRGYKIQIETNGTLYQPLPPEVDIICSPKNTGNGYFPIRPDLFVHISAFKFILSCHHPLFNHVPELGQATAGIPVYVQPMDEYNPQKNKENLDFAVSLAFKNGYRMSFQTHKIAGVA
jgi:7-carboxy-7-deazaguanine synthase